MEPVPVASDDRLIGICRSPVHCPVSACRQMIGVTTVLTHFLRDHRPTIGDDFQEVCADRRSLLVFYERFFERNDTAAVGVLVYAGRETGERPADAGLCRPNSFLPERYNAFTTHLPILILGCRTPAVAMLAADQRAHSDCSDSPAGEDMLVLWLATVETTRPLHCTISVFSADMKTSRSCIVPVRSLKDSQDPIEFVSTESSYLAINSGELQLLRAPDTGSIELEILVHELK